MANNKHLELLKSNITYWNAYVREQPLEFKADLSGAELAEVDFLFADLAGANLKSANLTKARLSRTNLTLANLSGATLVEVRLSGADLRLANLRSATLRRARLANANLREAIFRETDLYGTNLTKVNLSKADLSGANLELANLEDADLSQARLSRANLVGTNFSTADLNQTVLDGAFYSSSTVWPNDFDPKAAGAKKIEEDKPSTKVASSETSPTAVTELWRAEALETVEKKQLALQGSENIIGELQKIVDGERLSGDLLASLQSEIDVLSGLRRNPMFDIRRFEQTLAKVAELLGELDDLTEDTYFFLQLVQELGNSDPLLAGEQIGFIAEEVISPPTPKHNNPVSHEETKNRGPFGRGVEKGKEQLAENLVAKYLPRTAFTIASGTAATLGVKYGGASGLVKAVLETLLAFLA